MPTSTGPSSPRAGSRSSTVFDASAAQLAGVHRVQRVPATEKRGRRHSSNITVVAIDQDRTERAGLDRSQVRVDTFRATGPGGQHRNKTDSAVRLTHIPTGVVVTATEDRSQHVNRRVAWERLDAALAERDQTSAHESRNAGRAATFDQARTFTWTGWRDEVRWPGGRTSMAKALDGNLAPMLA